MTNNDTHRTLLQMIQAERQAAGERGPLTKKRIAQFRRDHPAYKDAALDTVFRSGSAMPLRPLTKLDRATAAWRAADGAMPPVGKKFTEFVESYTDEYDGAFYK